MKTKFKLIAKWSLYPLAIRFKFWNRVYFWVDGFKWQDTKQ